MIESCARSSNGGKQPAFNRKDTDRYRAGAPNFGLTMV